MRAFSCEEMQDSTLVFKIGPINERFQPHMFLFFFLFIYLFNYVQCETKRIKSIKFRLNKQDNMYESSDTVAERLRVQIPGLQESRCLTLTAYIGIMLDITNCRDSPDSMFTAKLLSRSLSGL